MSVGEIIAQLIAVRGAIQTAMGLQGNAGDEMTDAVGKVEAVLSGSEHELVAEGLDLWRRAETELTFMLQKLAAGDDSLADYMDVLSPGTGTRSTVIARPTGAELLKHPATSRRKRNFFRDSVEKLDQVDDAVKNLGQHSRFLDVIHPDLPTPPPYVITETGSHGPVMRAPDQPKADVPSGSMAAVVTGMVVVVGSKKAKDMAVRAFSRWRSK